MLSRLSLLFLAFINITGCFSQKINLGLYNESLLRSIVVCVEQGQYQLIDSDGFASDISAKATLLFTIKNDSILAYSNNKFLGEAKSFALLPANDDGLVSVKPLEPSLQRHVYDDGLKITSKWGVLQVINYIEIDKYVAGVVEAEGGLRAENEYYKSQALLCRTYAIQNLGRHTNDGFNLCDGVHCQAFNGRCSMNLEIIDATNETSGMALTDKDTTLILAVFHASCGGTTESAGNIWGSDRDYLVSVKDPYCINQNNINWSKTITLDDWISYLSKKGIKTTSSKDLSTECPKRCKLYKLNNQTLPFITIRSDFNLKSAYFSIKCEGKNVTFKGHGFGHGVGLCQEGAMEMARKGKNYLEIINFYFKNVHIFDIALLDPIKNPCINLIETP